MFSILTDLDVHGRKVQPARYLNIVLLHRPSEIRRLYECTYVPQGDVR